MTGGREGSRTPAAPTALGERVLAAALLAGPAAALLPGALGFLSLPGFLRFPLLGLAVVLCPGAAWTGLGRALEGPLPRRLAFILAGSSAVTLLALAASSVGPEPAPPAAFLGLLCGATLAGALIRPQGPLPRPGRPAGLIAAAFLASLAATVPAALWLVPPLEDHDFEIQATAWGLASALRPDTLTNRETHAYYAHPLLLHAFVAVSLGADGELPAVRGPHDSGLRARESLERGRPVDWEGEWRENHRAFLERPALGATRAPNMVLAAACGALLAWLALRLTGSAAWAAGALLLYLAAPETIVRQAYGGYHAITVVFLLMMAGLYMTDAPRPPAPGLRAGLRLRLDGAALACGFLAAISEQKTILGIAAVLLHALLAGRSGTAGAGTEAGAGGGVIGRIRAVLSDRAALSLSGGFVLGYAAWCAYGLITDAATFIRDHVQLHVLNRLLLDDVRFFASTERYSPPIPVLWTEFSAHTGWLLLPVAAAGTVLLLRRPAGRAGVLAVWILFGAVGFSLTDWRQTKHLMLLLPALVLAAVVLVARAAAARRRLAAALAAAALVLSLAANLRRDAALAADFGSMRITGASDIDGW